MAITLKDIKVIADRKDIRKIHSVMPILRDFLIAKFGDYSVLECARDIIDKLGGLDGDQDS